MKKIVSVLFLLTSPALWAQEFPIVENVPGGVVTVDLGPALVGSAVPRAQFRKRRVMVVRQDGEWKAVVGLALGLKPGRYRVSAILEDGKKHVYPFKVVDKKYPTQYITLKNRRQVDLSKKDLARYYRDVKEIKKAKSTWSDVPSPPLDLELPVQGRISSAFGLRRFFNDEPRKPHAGLDLAAPTGTPILAPADGVVLEAENFFFNGNTMFIDHGQGLVTMYNHMSRFEVKPGDHVRRGQIIGQVGATGRATGPHLHWSVILNQTMVDPAAFVSPQALAALPIHTPKSIPAATSKGS
ncbi:MAG: peptidoglycan DD-metalloendopeptidase family protein [Acidiferrobacteraceae bacterium]|jgi:murein DD-endopeptidase MepM/ murein hydrolase activator NlpD